MELQTTQTILLITIVLILAGSLALVVILFRKTIQELRVFRERQQRLEQLMSHIYLEKSIDLLQSIRSRIRAEHQLLRSVNEPQAKAWLQIEALFEGENNNYSTALKILTEARRMYEERLRLLDRLSQSAPPQ